jgi:hypothetical protein
MFPIFVGVFLWRNSGKISAKGAEDESLANFKVLFEDKNLEKPYGFILFPFIFLTRRILLIIFALSDPVYTSIYLMVVVYVHLAYITWLLWQKPFESKVNNTIEVFNETLGLYLLYFLRMLCDRA